jgi:hypothetical protein
LFLLFVAGITLVTFSATRKEAHSENRGMLAELQMPRIGRTVGEHNGYLGTCALSGQFRTEGSAGLPTHRKTAEPAGKVVPLVYLAEFEEGVL